MNEKNYCVYIISNKRNGTLYTGVTNNLLRRIIEHKRMDENGFSKKYGLNKLVWFEQTNDVKLAIQKEKQMKKWKREFKINVIEKMNPEWKDLFFEIGGTKEMLTDGFLPKK